MPSSRGPEAHPDPAAAPPAPPASQAVAYDAAAHGSGSGQEPAAPGGEPRPREPVPFAGGSRRIPVVPQALHDVDVRHLVRRDPLPRLIVRRLISLPALLVLTIVWWLAGVVVLPALAVADLVRGRPLVLARFHLAIGAILFGQVWGVLLTIGIWVASGFGLAWRRQNRWWLWAEGLWAEWTRRAVARVYRMTYVVEGSELLRDGPTILLMRHASINDTIVPIALITRPHGVRLRIVLKAELGIVPVVDLLGERIPTAFVRRNSGNPERELDACRALTRDLHPQETIMIFPEGTRFTEERQAAILARLRDKDPEAAARAEELTHVLPLRLGGTHALVDGAPHADLVLCAHTGFERSAKLADYVRGALFRTAVRFKFWRIPAAQVPTDHAERAAFLHEQWKKVDAWIAEHRATAN